MIEFSGEYSKSSKNLLFKIWAKSLRFSFSIPCAIMGVVVLILSAALKVWELLIFSGALFFGVILSCLVPYIKSEQKNMLVSLPLKVVIDEDGSIEAEWGDYSMVKLTEEVRKILDYGECYLIKFKIPYGRAIFCQKDLIKGGTTEDFEKLFPNKIIRKIKKR
mgnify:CR=1 FL=1